MKTNGFTLLEVMLSVAVLGVVGIFSIPIFQAFQVRNDLDIAVENTVHVLRRAQVYARSGANDSSWGVQVTTSSIVLFQGQTYSTRDTQWDEITAFPSDVIASSTPTIYFLSLNGQTSGTSAISFASINNEVRNIVINKYGTAEY